MILLYIIYIKLIYRLYFIYVYICIYMYTFYYLFFFFLFKEQKFSLFLFISFHFYIHFFIFHSMIVDNFNIIKEFLITSCEEQEINFDKDPDIYYEIRILTRNKDFNEAGHNNDFSHTYYIFKISDIDRYKDNIITLCNVFNARAYFVIRRKSVKRLLLNCNIAIAESLANNAKTKPWKMVDHISLTTHSSKDKKWLIDIDTKDLSYLCYIRNTIKELGGKCYCELPTPHGFHIITTPFRFEEYKKKLELDQKPFSNANKCYSTLIYANVPDN